MLVVKKNAFSVRKLILSEVSTILFIICFYTVSKTNVIPYLDTDMKETCSVCRKKWCFVLNSNLENVKKPKPCQQSNRGPPVCHSCKQIKLTQQSNTSTTSSQQPSTQTSTESELSQEPQQATNNKSENITTPSVQPSATPKV